MPIKEKSKRYKNFKKSMRRRWRHFLTLHQRRWFRWTILPVFATLSIVVAIIVVSYALFPPVKDYNFGVSFSARQSENLGLDWKANYSALLDDLEIRNYRLMSYWDEIEADRGKFDFSRLDYQMDEAAKRGAKVSLAIGERQPRWPECHTPAWAKDLRGHEWKQALYAYIEVVVKRYENHPALDSWQLENEYFNAGFGECDPPDQERFYEEVLFVKSLSQKPLYASLADQHGLPIFGPEPDAYGYSIYRFVYNDKIIPGYMWYPTPLWYHHLRASLIKILHPDADLFIHELQLEPWGPTDTKGLSVAEQDKTMDYDQIHENVTFARQIGFKDIYTWGGEWWYWRKVVHNDPSIWEAVRREVEASRN